MCLNKEGNEMSEDINLAEAKKVLASLIEELEECGWRYELIEDKLLVHFSGRGDDLPMEFFISVDPERELVTSRSVLPFELDPEKLIESSVAVALVNYKLVDGNFEFDPKEGHLFFKLTSSFKDSLLSKEFFKYLIHFAVVIVDEFNEKLLMLAKGMIDLEKFMEIINA